MGDDWADEEVPMDNIEQPTTMMAELPEVKLFGKWPCEDVQVIFHTLNLLSPHVSNLMSAHVYTMLLQVSDMSLQDYIAVKEKYAKYLPHSAGRLVSDQGLEVNPAMHISWEFNLTMVKYLEPMCNRNS